MNEKKNEETVTDCYTNKINTANSVSKKISTLEIAIR